MVEINEFIHDHPQVKWLRVESNSTSEFKKVAQNVAESIHLASQRIHTMCKTIAFRLRNIQLHEVLAEQLRVEPHRGQWILYFMRQAAGH